MKPKNRRWLSMLFIVVMLAVILIVAFSNGEMTNAWTTLFTLDGRWVFAALCCWLVYFVFDAISLHYFLRKQGYPIRFTSALYVSMTGFFYGNITPGASGGQPLQVYAMNKRKVPVAIGTSAVSIKLFSMQAMVILMATVFWICNASFVDTQLAGAKWAIYIGWGINFIAIPGIMLFAFCRPLVMSITGFVVRLLGRMHVLKKPEETLLRVTNVIDSYHASIQRVGRHPGQVLVQLLLAGISMLGLIAVTLCVYYAFGMNGQPWYQVLTVSFLLFLSASYTPLPGASGAQEGGFLVFFRGMFTQGTIGLSLLVWRFFTYYLFLVIGALLSLLDGVRPKRCACKADGAEQPADGSGEATDEHNEPAENDPSMEHIG